MTEQLVERCLSGDKGAFDELVRQNMNIVFGVVVGMVHNYHLAEDLTQDVFTKAYVSLPRLQDPQKFRNWLCRIARNSCLDYLRQKKLHTSLETGTLPISEPEALPAMKGDEASEELSNRLMNEVDKLRADYRQILILKHLEGLSYREIGNILNMSVSAVGEKLFRVRQLLKKNLEKTGEARPL